MSERKGYCDYCKYAGERENGGKGGPYVNCKSPEARAYFKKKWSGKGYAPGASASVGKGTWQSEYFPGAEWGRCRFWVGK